MYLLSYGAVGLLAGVVGSWLGIGGGALLVPVLILAYGVDTKVAIGTSLATIVPIALSAAIRHHMFGKVNWTLVGPMAVGGLIGGIIGAWILDKTPGDIAKRALAIFWIFSAVRLWMTTIHPR